MGAASPPLTDGWLARHKGGVALLFAFVLLAIAWPLHIAWLKSGAEAAIVGGLCDWVALIMLFDRVRFLPGFGIIPRNHERIVKGIARAVGQEWLSDRAVAEQVERIDLAPVLRAGIERYGAREEVVKAVLRFLADRLATFVESETFHLQVTERVRVVGGRVGTVAHAIGILDYEEVAARVAQEVRATVEKAAESPEVVRRIVDEGNSLGQRLVLDPDWGEQIERAKREVAQAAAPVIRERVSDAVIQRLGRFTPEELKEMLKAKAGPSLEWIRVNGAALGFIVGVVLHFAGGR